MTISQYSPIHRREFEEMLVEYFVFTLKSDIPEDIVRGKLLDFIIDNAGRNINHVAIASKNGAPIGFSIYQIDCPNSDWCKRPGWGFIREFFIRRDHRGRGYGTALAAFTEKQLRTMGADQLYLTSDNAIGFWLRCGWSRTHEICSNDLEILIK